MVEEVKDPLKRNIVFSIIISSTVITVIYCLTNFSYLAVLTPSELLAADAVAMTFGAKIIAGLFWLMPFFVACSTFGNMNNSIMNTSRLGLAATRRHHLPEFLSLINVNLLTPIPVLMVNLVVSLLLLTSNDLYTLLLYTSYLGNLSSFISIVGLVWIKVRRKDELVMPFQLPLAIPIFYVVVALIILIFPIFQRPVITGLSVAVFLSGLPVYFLVVKRDLPPWLLRANQRLTHFVQKLSVALPEDFEDNLVKTKDKGLDNPAFEGKEEGEKESHKDK